MEMGRSDTCRDPNTPEMWFLGGGGPGPVSNPFCPEMWFLGGGGSWTWEDPHFSRDVVPRGGGSRFGKTPPKDTRMECALVKK